MTTKYRSLGKSYTGTGEDTDDLLIQGRGSLTVSGTFTGGTVQLLRSDADQSNFVPCLGPDLLPIEISVPGTVAIHEDAVDGGRYRTKCTAFSSGQIDTRLLDVGERR